jgi:hypothetical protein
MVMGSQAVSVLMSRVNHCGVPFVNLQARKQLGLGAQLSGHAKPKGEQTPILHTPVGYERLLFAVEC